MEPAIFFSGSPNLDELCSVTINVLVTKGLNQMRPQIVKCREMIFLEPDVLASPCFDLDSCFNVVLQRSLFQTGRLQSRLQKQGMQMSKPNKVHPGMYQSCLIYTIITKLSPTWNKAGEWMIQGRDFVTHEGFTNAIKMSLNVNREEIYVSLAGAIVKFPPLQIEDMNLTRSEMQAILKSTEGIPHAVELTDTWCHVLPSLKRGRLSSITLVIPNESPFSSYKELKKHWKNMYGYRLPETDDDILYCQIGFLSSGGGNQFTYPSACLRSSHPQLVPRTDPKPVLTAFLQELHARMSTVCGMPLRFQPKLRYAAPALHSSAQPSVKVNLSSKPQNKPNGPLRSKQSMAAMYDSNTTKKAPIRERLCTSSSGRASMLNSSLTQNHQHSIASSGELISSNNHSNQNDNPISIWDQSSASQKENKFNQTSQNQPSSSQNQSSASQKENKFNQTLQNQPSFSKTLTQSLKSDPATVSSSKFVPLFRPKMKLATPCPSSSVSKNKLPDTPSSRTVPVFRSHTPKSTPTTKNMNQANSSSLALANGELKSNSNKNSTQNISETALIPDSSNLFLINDKDKPSGAELKLPPPTRPMFSKQPKHSLPGSQTPKLKTPTSKLNSKPTTPKYPTPKPSPKVMKTPSAVNIVHNNVSAESPNLAHIQSTQASLNNSQSCMGTPQRSISTSQRAMGTPQIPFSFMANLDDDDDFDNSLCTPTASSAGVKRKLQNEVDTTPKKPRAKPQVQNVDVEALARARQLSKINALTLTTWLKDKGVTCKAKDKKTDLVDKIYSFLNLSLPEQ